MKSKFIVLFPLFVMTLALTWAFAGMTAVSRTVRAASDYYVATTGDDANDCLSPANACATLGGAVGKAAAGDAIHIAAGTYNNTNVTISSKDLTITGAGMNQTILDGSGADRVMLLNGSATTLSRLTIRNGSGNNLGAGIAQFGGSLILTNVRLTGNTSTSTTGGGGIFSNAPLTMTNSIVDNNQATYSGSNGGGVYLNNQSSGSILLENVTIYGNSSGNVGGGIHNQSTMPVTLRNVTVSGNNSGWAAGLEFTNTGVTTLVNVTVANNTSTNPSGPAVQNYANAVWVNSIVANNSGPDCADGGASWTSNGYNLSSDATCGFTQTGDTQNSDPLLTPLGAYGGDVPTLALKLGSPAIDMGGAGSCPATDARGVSRPKDGDNSGGAACDKGAFEFERVSSTAVAISGDSAGLTNSSYTFQAAVQPITNTFPITYTWQADGQSNVAQTGGYTDTVSFTWSSAGSKTITVTANNGVNSVVDTHQINITPGVQPVTGVAISGPASGSQNQAYSFTASVAPGSATTPITYTWTVDSGAPVVQTGQGTSAALNGVTFSSDGAHTVAVTADNGAGSASDSHAITVTSWYVNDASGDDANNCTSAATACKTIRQAVFKASSDGAIFVAAGVYSESEMDVSGKDLTIVGSGAADTIVDGGGNGAVFWLQSSGGGVPDVTLADMTIRNGYRSASSGGGIYNDVNLTLRRVIVENNRSLNDGGGVYNDGRILTVTDSIIRGNTTSSSAGSALVNNGGTLVISNTAVINNNGAAAALRNINGGAVTLTNVTFSGNGSGISASGGTTVTAVNVTIAYNRGDGITNYGTSNVKNSILANNGSDNCAGNALVSQGYNLDSGSSCGLNGTGDMSNTNPGLFPLAHYGDTWLHAFSANSPARDKGTNSGCPADDQSGTSRPKNGTCDIGAFEYDPANPPKTKVYLPLVVRP